MNSIQAPARKLDICHLGRHWTIEPCSDSAHGEVAQLNHVCWLQVDGRLYDVPCGLFVARWRIRLSTLDFSCDWRVRLERQEVDATGKTRWTIEKETCSSHKKPNEPETEPLGKHMQQLMKSQVRKGWFHLELGVWHLEQGAKKLSFQLFGGNPYWCRGLDIDYFELLPYRLNWGVERLLWLGCFKDEGSYLFSLPRDVVKDILKHLAVMEATAEGESMPRARPAKVVKQALQCSAR